MKSEIVVYFGRNIDRVIIILICFQRFVHFPLCAVAIDAQFFMHGGSCLIKGKNSYIRNLCKNILGDNGRKFLYPFVKRPQIVRFVFPYINLNVFIGHFCYLVLHGKTFAETLFQNLIVKVFVFCRGAFIIFKQFRKKRFQAESIPFFGKIPHVQSPSLRFFRSITRGPATARTTRLAVIITFKMGHISSSATPETKY